MAKQTQKIFTPETYLVRLKPYNPRRGHTKRTYVYKNQTFLADAGWYRVLADDAEFLRNVRQNHRDPDSDDAFDVCTDEEAIRLEKREKEKEIQRASATNPNVSNARDVAAFLKQEERASGRRKAKVDIETSDDDDAPGQPGETNTVGGDLTTADLGAAKVQQ